MKKVDYVSLICILQGYILPFLLYFVSMFKYNLKKFFFKLLKTLKATTKTKQKLKKKTNRLIVKLHRATFLLNML